MSIYVKQYGAERTGTNVLRLLLPRAFPGARVLMHVLGDKHSAPAPALIHALDAGIAAPEVVARATAERPSRTTDAGSSSQRARIAEVAAEVADAVATRGLRVVVSLKHPHAWAASLTRPRGWTAASLRSGPARAGLVAACERFNAAYHAWAALADRGVVRASFVTHEALLADPTACLRGVGRALELGEPAPVDLPAGVVLPTHWDDDASVEHHERFERSYYDGRGYLDRLGAAGIAAVSDAIDWGFFGRWGYQPR
ncbi:MAG: hypothetical protein R3B09_30500 [Nannocystaceae bacterium]